jgi:hypothetical protein
MAYMIGSQLTHCTLNHVDHVTLCVCRIEEEQGTFVTLRKITDRADLISMATKAEVWYSLVSMSHSVVTYIASNLHPSQ